MIRQSPAKVNLFLKVLGRREDGYHDIATLMQRISLYDELDISLEGKDIRVRCPGSSLPENGENIVYKAAKVLLARARCSRGVEIILRKRIPIASGLGGGSSNAATTLVTLNELLGRPFSDGELMKMGAEIGADVPFFIFRKTAWAFGIGDQLREAERVPDLWFVLLNPGFGISTKMVYENLNLGLTKEGIRFSIQNFLTAGDMARGLQNDLEKVAFRLHPLLLDLKRILVDHGALGSLMSGSGATVFGIFAEEQDALRAGEELKQAGKWSVFTAHSL
jgi:4-diphosphocytidyl-2-C-methyl-D-erythritol kinase